MTFRGRVRPLLFVDGFGRYDPSVRPYGDGNAVRYRGSSPVPLPLHLASRLRSEQILDPHRQAAHANASRVVDGGGDRRSDARETNLANPPGSVLTQHRVGNVEEVHIDR